MGILPIYSHTSGAEILSPYVQLQDITNFVRFVTQIKNIQAILQRQLSQFATLLHTKNYLLIYLSSTPSWKSLKEASLSPGAK